MTASPFEFWPIARMFTAIVPPAAGVRLNPSAPVAGGSNVMLNVHVRFTLSSVVRPVVVDPICTQLPVFGFWYQKVTSVYGLVKRPLTPLAVVEMIVDVGPPGAAFADAPHVVFVGQFQTVAFEREMSTPALKLPLHVLFAPAMIVAAGA